MDKVSFGLELCTQRMIEIAIPIAVENREKALILHRVPPWRGRTDRRHRIFSPSQISLVVRSPVRVRRRVFDVLYVRSIRKLLERTRSAEKVLSLTALNSKALL